MTTKSLKCGLRKSPRDLVIRHGEGHILQELADDLRSCKET